MKSLANCLTGIAVAIALLTGIARAETSGASDLSSDGWQLWLDPQAVLERFNPENEPGCADGIVKTFTVDITNGELVVSIPAVQHSHDPRLGFGFGVATITVGQGQIVVLCLPGLSRSIESGENQGIHPVSARRLLYNALK
jgi:hypothetical protein